MPRTLQAGDHSMIPGDIKTEQEQQEAQVEQKERHAIEKQKTKPRELVPIKQENDDQEEKVRPQSPQQCSSQDQEPLNCAPTAVAIKQEEQEETRGSCSKKRKDASNPPSRHAPPRKEPRIRSQVPANETPLEHVPVSPEPSRQSIVAGMEGHQAQFSSNDLDEDLATGIIDETTYWKKKFLLTQKEKINQRKEKDQQIQQYKVQILSLERDKIEEGKEKDQQLQSMTRNLKDLQKQNLLLHSARDQKDKDQHLQSLVKQLDEKSLHLCEKEHQLQAMSKTLAGLQKNQLLHEKDCRERNQQIQALEKSITDYKTQIHSLCKEKVKERIEKDQQLEALRKSSDGYKDQCCTLQQKIRKLETVGLKSSPRGNEVPNKLSSPPVAKLPPKGYTGEDLRQSCLKRSVALNQVQINKHQKELGLSAWFRSFGGAAFCFQEVSHLTLMPACCQLPYSEHQTLQYWVTKGISERSKIGLQLLDPNKHPQHQAVPAFWVEKQGEGESFRCRYVGHFQCIYYDYLQSTKYNGLWREALLGFEFVQFDEKLAQTMKNIANVCEQYHPQNRSFTQRSNSR